MNRVLFGKKIVPHHMLTFAEQVYDILVAEIQGGRWKAGERLPGVINLAKDLGFGTKTIQTAYDRLKDEGFVRTLGYRGTYLESTRPQPLGDAGRISIAVRSEEGADPLLVWYEHVLFERARRRNLMAKVIEPATGSVVEAGGLWTDGAGGVVALSPFRLARQFSGQQGEVPVVFLCPPYEDCAPRVSADVIEASRELALAVVAAGHSRVAFSEDIVEPDPRLTEMQLQGFREGMQASGLTMDKEITVASRRVRHDDPGSVEAHLRELAATTLQPRPTAVFAGSLGRAMALIEAAPRVGVGIPQDLSIVCIGSAPVGREGEQQITGMLPDFNFMADTCLDLLSRQREMGRSDVSSVSVRMHLVPGHTLRTLGRAGGADCSVSAKSSVTFT